MNNHKPIMDDTKLPTITASQEQQSGCEILSTSGSSTRSTPTLIHLKLQVSKTFPGDNSSIPYDIAKLRQQLREKELSIRQQQASLEQQLEKERQKIHQKVFFAIMQQQQQDSQSDPGPFPLGDGSAVEEVARHPTASVKNTTNTKSTSLNDPGARAQAAASPPLLTQEDSPPALAPSPCPNSLQAANSQGHNPWSHPVTLQENTRDSFPQTPVTKVCTLYTP